MPTKIVAIAGGSGFIGRAIARRLAAIGEIKVRVLTRNPDAAYERLKVIGVEFVRADIADPATLKDSLAGASAIVDAVQFDGYPVENPRRGLTFERVDYGGTVALIALSEFIDTDGFSAFKHAESPTVHIVVASLFAAIIGSISFWGSLIAFGKLQEILPGRPIGLGRAQQALNALLLIAAIGAAVVIGLAAHPGSGGASLWWMVGLLAAAAVLGLMVVLPIGGADMPVVISLLNAMTGLSAAAAGLALNNTAMIVAGMIVGASGSILTNLMAKAMNRSIPAIVAGGFGGGGVAVGGGDDGDKVVRATSAADAAIQMAYANQVIVVPGYGLAVAQAQHAVKDLANLLEDKGVPVKYAIHPVAGRMPGHMNVLLAEAEVDYDAMKDMDDINDEFGRTDVTIVIGANDVTNPAARNDPSSPIHGMPILNVDQSKSVIVLKRSMNSGFAGIDNPLFYADGTTMLFGDAKKSVSEVAEELKVL